MFNLYKIKTKINCVCFSEVVIDYLSHTLATSVNHIC